MMMKHAAQLMAILLALSARTFAGAVPMKADFYVAADGNDKHPGTKQRPFATLARARGAVCERIRAGLKAPITVLVRGGVYELAEPLVFGPEDSGTQQHAITYAAFPGERVVLSGGRKVAGWRRGEGDVWTAEVPGVREGKWHFRQLFVNGRRARRARSPSQGYFRVVGLVEAKPGARWNQGVDRFRFTRGDIRPWPDLQDVEVVVFHSWNTSRVRIASVAEDKGVVTFTGPTVFRPLGWDPEQRYYVENAPDALDSPGEWYLNRRAGVLRYWPLPGEDLRTAEVVAPVLRELLRFAGDPDGGKFVEHIRVVGLSFQHADWTLPAKGHGDPQAAVTVPAVVSATGARHCTLEGCEIAHVGTYGVWFSRGCKDNRIVRNHIHDLGAGGVRIGEAKMAETDAAESSRNLVSNNYIHDGGHVYAAAVGLWLAQSSHNIISHNEIHSFNYSGMSIGWNWNDAPNRTHHNRIEHNHIHHVARGVLSDAGGIYTLGTQIGTVIRHNLIHDVFPYRGKPAMAWGIYLDQGTNRLLIENNIVYHTLTGGIMNTGSHGNTIRNNVFALSAWHAVWRWQRKKDPATVFERNIIYLTQGDLFHMDGGRDDTRSKWDHNLFWRADGQPLLFYGDAFTAWQAKGMGRHSLVAAPQFVDVARFDFRLRPGSPALKLGFQPIDMGKNGLFGPAEWVALPRRATFPPTVLPPVPPPPKPVAVDDGFEKTPAGQPPALATLFVEGRGDSIRVAAETAAAGKHSLKFTDAPGLKHPWNPHMFYAPHFREGRATLSFALRLEEGAVFSHEWRDAAHPYRVGPSIGVDAGRQLLAAGKPLAAVPFGKWFRVQIVCGLGKKAGGTYDLTLTLPGERPRVFPRLPCGSSKFQRLEWLGFVSNATRGAAFYLDNVELKLDKGPGPD